MGEDNKNAIIGYLSTKTMKLKEILELEAILIDRPSIFIHNLVLDNIDLSKLGEWEKILLLSIIVKKRKELEIIQKIWGYLENKTNCLFILLDAINGSHEDMDIVKWLASEINLLIPQFTKEIFEYSLIKEKLNDSKYAEYIKI